MPDPYADFIRAGDASLATSANKLPTMTTLPPGPQKVPVLADRFRHRQQLWHPLDPVLSNGVRDGLERLTVEALPVANGRPVNPQIFEEVILRATRAEIDLDLQTEDVGPMLRLWHIEPPPGSCPVCSWWHKDGNKCSWCGLDLERAAGIERRRQDAEAAEDAYSPAEIDTAEC